MLGYLGTPWDTIGYQQCSKRPNQPLKYTITLSANQIQINFGIYSKSEPLANPGKYPV